MGRQLAQKIAYRYSKMLRFFKSKHKTSKKSKEISLIVESGPHEEPYVARLPKHLLVEHSEVFRRMAENGELKKNRKVKLEEITAIGLKKVVEYIGKDSVFFQNHYEAIDCLKAAYIYKITAMHNICSNFLITIIDSGNVCEIFEFASTFSFHNLEYHCLKYIDEHSKDVLKSPAFLTLKKATVMDIVKRSSLNITSEIDVFKAVLTWGLNDCLRRGVDTEKIEEMMNSTKSLFEKVKFLTMSQEELEDPEVEMFYKLIYTEDSNYKMRSLLQPGSKPRSSTGDSINLQPRKYEKDYVLCLEAHGYDEHAVKNGETYSLRTEVLKGKVFLTAVTVAFDTFVNTKNTACLYAALSATNIQTADQKTARGTFLNFSEEAVLKFPSPLVVKESETVEMTLNVKRAENICPMIIKSDIQIAMPDNKEVALKITPSNITDESERSMFKSITYFF